MLGVGSDPGSAGCMRGWAGSGSRLRVLYLVIIVRRGLCLVSGSVSSNTTPSPSKDCDGVENPVVGKKTRVHATMYRFVCRSQSLFLYPFKIPDPHPAS